MPSTTLYNIAPLILVDPLNPAPITVQPDKEGFVVFAFNDFTILTIIISPTLTPTGLVSERVVEFVTLVLIVVPTCVIAP